MKIGIDIRCLMSRYRSGVGEYTYNAVGNILKLDRQNQYFLFYNSFSKVGNNLPDWGYPNVQFVKYRWPNKLFNLLQFFGFAKLDKLCGGVDVFWLPNWHFASFSKKCKLIVTVHDLSHAVHPEFLSLKRRLWHKLLRIKKLFRRADKIIAVSKSTENDLVELFEIDPSKIDQIYSGVNNYSEISLTKVNKVKQKFGIKNEFIFSISTLEPRKNIEGIILSYTKLRIENPNLDVDLVIAGGNGWRYEKIYRLREKSEFRKQIKIIGYISSEEKQCLYSCAKLFVYPSFYEGFGIPPLEAMSCKCPVITGINSSLSEIVGSAGILINVWNLSEISFAMKHLLINDGVKKSMTEDARKRVETFSWEESARKTIRSFYFDKVV